jgi:hypothetical protein
MAGILAATRLGKYNNSSTTFVDFAIFQGNDIAYTITYKDSLLALIDLTGYTAEMKLRSVNRNGAILDTWTSANGKLILGGTTGAIDFAVTSAVTAAYTVGKGVYDLQLTDTGSDVQTLIKGTFEIVDEVTR